MITFNEKNKTFNIRTENSSYVLGVFEEKHLLNLHYGGRVENFYDGDIYDILMTPLSTNSAAKDIDNKASTNLLPVEYPSFGRADYRTPAFHAEYKSGSGVTSFEYVGYSISKGKKPLSGLPSCYENTPGEAETLEITLRDGINNMEAVLSYSTFEGSDAICRSVRLKNVGSDTVDIRSALSQSAYLFDKDFEFVHLSGSWARERHIEKMPLTRASVSIDSKKVSSSHDHSPFIALARPDANEDSGEVYGFSLCYSGSFFAQAEVNVHDTVRINMGINPFGFSWKLEPGEEFQTPEVISVYSGEGFGHMSRTYHRLYRNNLCRGKWKDAPRPILINNWEATYFDFSEEKILTIAKCAKAAGIELMVLDDGWFGKRNDDTSSLGDWFTNREKLPDGIDSLARKVSELGMRFGLWFEPEMVSPDSELYRAHPDWCVHSFNHPRSLSRNQLVLDLSRKDVRDYVVEAISKVLSSAPITYVKWDMNRTITEIGSAELDQNHQAELPHRYILGLYEILDRVMTAFPDVLFEGCSGGGGRFDPGMIAYFPQFWTSDCSDATERYFIQYGTSMVMPSCTMGAHVSAVPNHQIERVTPLKSRGNIAMAGQFGYELDLAKLSVEEFEEVKAQVIKYKEIRETVHKGEMYRLKSPFESNFCSWMFVNEDKSEAVFTFSTILAKALDAKCNVKLRDLDKNADYMADSGKVYSGDFLMNVGLYFKTDRDFNSEMIVFKRI